MPALAGSKPGDHAQAGCLAAAGRADDGDKLFFSDLEIDVVERLHAAGSTEDLVDIFELDRTHAAVSSSFKAAAAA